MSEKDPLAAVRDATATFAGFSASAYACGYLALRARARALGVDPGFALLDEVYVFAGFRFVLSLLLALLLLAPVFAAARALAGRSDSRPPLAGWLAWLGVAALAGAVFIQLQALGVRDLLLAPPPYGVLASAVLGRGGWGVGLFFAAVAGAAAGALWLRARLRGALHGGATAALALVVAMQLLFLPAIQGMFFADRLVRVLDRPPAAASSLAGAVGVVERSKDKVVLIGVAGSGGIRLVTVGADMIDGIGVGRIVTISQFLDQLRGASLAIGLAAATPAVAQPATAHAQTTEPFWQIVVGQLRHTLENIGSLGEGRAESGAVLVVRLDGGRLAGAPRRLGSRADLSWPVIGADGLVYALEGGHLMRLASDGGATPAGPHKLAWRKLVGVAPDGVVAGVLADPAPFGRTALLSHDDSLVADPPPATPQDRRRQGVLLQESQALAGGRGLRVGRSARGGRGFDVFLDQPGAAPLDISDCGDDSCGQPSMAPDGSAIIYIRQPR